MFANTDTRTRLIAPSILAAALALILLPFDRWLPAARAHAHSPRIFTPASWFEAGPVHMDALLSRSRLLRGGDGSVFLDLRLSVPGAPPSSSRPPLDVALALDVSRSLSDPKKLELLTETCLGISSELGPDDRIAVIAFAATARTLLSLDGHRSEPLVSPGSPNVASGLETAWSELERSRRPGAARRLLLVSDARGSGALDALSALSSRIAASGTSVSTIGLGLDYDESLLSTLADLGGGTYHHVDSTDRVRGMFEAELRSLGSVVAKGVRVRIEPAPGVELSEIEGWSSFREGNSTIVRVGDFSSGRSAKVVARLKVPTTGPSDVSSVVRVSLDATDVERDSVVSAPSADLALALTSSSSEASSSDLSVQASPAVASASKQGYSFACSYSFNTSEYLWFALSNSNVPVASGDRYFETSAAGVIFYTTSSNLALDTSTCTLPNGLALPLGKGDLRTITTSQSVFREGDKETDGVADYGMLTELSNASMIDSVLGQGSKQGYYFSVDSKQLDSVRKDIEDASVASDLDRARRAASRGDRAGARAALASVRASRSSLEYRAADGKVERRTIDELERALTSDAASERASAEKFATYLPVGK